MRGSRSGRVQVQVTSTRKTTCTCTGSTRGTLVLGVHQYLYWNLVPLSQEASTTVVLAVQRGDVYDLQKEYLFLVLVL